MNESQHSEVLDTIGPKLAITSNNRIHLVDIHDVVRCESSNNYTFFHFKDQQKLLSCKTLKAYEVLLNDHGFVRVHQCHLVNMRFVRSVEKASVLILHMQSGDQVPVSHRKKDTLLRYIHSACMS